MGKKVLGKINDQKGRSRPHEEAAGSGGKGGAIRGDLAIRQNTVSCSSKLMSLTPKSLVQSQSAPSWLGALDQVTCPLCALVCEARITIITTSMSCVRSKLVHIYKVLRMESGMC